MSEAPRGFHDSHMFTFRKTVNYFTLWQLSESFQHSGPIFHFCVFRMIDDLQKTLTSNEAENLVSV